MKCNVCGALEAQSYHLGRVRGHLCAACQHGAGGALASWSLKRMREVERNTRADRALGAARDDVANEQLPLSTRRAMREARTA